MGQKCCTMNKMGYPSMVDCPISSVSSINKREQGGSGEDWRKGENGGRTDGSGACKDNIAVEGNFN